VVPSFKVRLGEHGLSLKPGDRQTVDLSPCAEVDLPSAVILSLNHGLCVEDSAIVCMSSDRPSSVSIVNKGIRAVDLGPQSVAGRADNLLMPQPFRNLMQWRTKEVLERPLFGSEMVCKLVSSASVSVLAGKTVSLACNLEPDLSASDVAQFDLMELKVTLDKFELAADVGRHWTGSMLLRNSCNKIQHVTSRSVVGSVLLRRHLDKNMKVVLLNLQAEVEVSVRPGAFFSLVCKLDQNCSRPAENSVVEVLKFYNTDGVRVLTDTLAYLPDTQLGFMAQNVSEATLKAGSKINIGCASAVVGSKSR
jgi:hypothetical protein